MAPARKYADMGRRFAALLLDGLVMMGASIPGIILYIIGIVQASRSGSDSSDVAAIMMLIGWLLIGVGCLAMFIFNIYLLGRDGATLGKRWMKIRVLDQSGNPLGFGKAFLRELVKGTMANAWFFCFLFIVLSVLLLWPLWDNEKQGLYDKLFNTHVYDA